MLLRPRQKLFVERSLTALDKHQNTLGVAPTGAGKTIMLSGVTGQWLENEEAKACVLAHLMSSQRKMLPSSVVLIPGYRLRFMTQKKSRGTVKRPSPWYKP